MEEELLEYRDILTSLETRPQLLTREQLERELIQDYILFNLLNKIEPPYQGYLVLKGGTCLSRCYLNYHRFSYDLDFTWYPVEEIDLTAMSRKTLRKYCNTLINAIASQLEDIAKNTKNIILFRNTNVFKVYGSSSRMITFRVIYVSTKGSGEMKIQIRFIDRIVEKPVQREITSYVSNLLKSYGYDYRYIVRGYVYTLREIASEKLRAILTRVGVPTKGIESILKDIYDLYKIYEVHSLKPDSVKRYAKEKLLFILKLERKYSVQDVEIPRNPNSMRTLLENTYGARIDPENFSSFYSNLRQVLEELKETASMEASHRRRTDTC